MLNRRKSRTGHVTAYTGVNHVAAPSNQPNSNALAAALTIGKALNESAGGKSGQYEGGSSRKSSLQKTYRQAPSQEGRGSLLHRNSTAPHKHSDSTSEVSFSDFSEATTQSKGSVKTPSTPPLSRSQRGVGHDESFSINIDDSFNDSYIDAITDETTRIVNSNRANMKDLKLSHRPLSPPPSNGIRNSGSRGSLRGDSSEVKMIKKYIPTPTGIKIVEVPESSFKKEIARNNSIRSGMNTSRLGSMNSVTRKPSLTGINRQVQGARKQSLVKKPSMTPMKEDVEPVHKSKEASSQNEQLRNLELKIKNEQKLARDLEQKRKEYEELKRKRILEEKRLTMLQQDDTSEEDVPLPRISFKVDELDKAISHNGASSPIRGSADTFKVESGVAKNGEAESASDIEGLEDEVNASIDPSRVVVDELEQKERVEDESEVLDNHINPTKEKDVPSPIIGKVGEQSETSVIKRDVGGNTLVERDEALDIDELNGSEYSSTSMAKHLRPKFDTVPEIIEDVVSESSSDKLPIPSVLASNDGSSLSSVNSGLSADGSSSSKTKPVKSAMKNRSPIISKKEMNGTISNPAHQAYLSLTTAENTRLNSKLSSSQLDEGVTESLASPVRNTFPVSQPKPHKTTLRKSPNQPGNFPIRTLRPQSIQDVNQLKGHVDHQPNGGGMSFRTLRDTTVNYNNPSPMNINVKTDDQASKVRAANLYAKASARPVSVFKPLKRSSSFSRANPGEDSQAQDSIPKGRTTLRDYPTTSKANTLTQERPKSQLDPGRQPASHSTNRLDNSSDDEDQFNVNSHKLPSRFDDSDNENEINLTNTQGNTVIPDIAEQKEPVIEQKKKKATKEPNNRKDKKKFRKLKKIFGK